MRILNRILKWIGLLLGLPLLMLMGLMLWDARLLRLLDGFALAGLAPGKTEHDGFGQ